MKKPSKYWFESKSYGNSFRIPISKEGYVFYIVYVVIGIPALILTVPKKDNPTFVQFLPLITVGLLLTIIFVAVTTFKAEPRPKK